MKKRKIKIHSQLDYQSPKGQTFTGESKTISGESYTIRQLLERNAQGSMPPVQRQPLYDENPDIDHPDETRTPDFDLADVTRLKQQSENILSQSRKKANFKEPTKAEKTTPKNNELNDEQENENTAEK